MVESTVARLLLDGSIVLLVLASIVEVIVDVRGTETSSFLPAPLSGFPSSDPATALATAGFVGLVLGVLLTLNPLPGGRLIVGFVSLLAFLFAGGYVISDESASGGGLDG